MDSPNTLLQGIKSGLLANAALRAVATDLKEVSGGSGNHPLFLELGNVFRQKAIPASLYPFCLLVVGDEVSRVSTAAGTQITRRLDFHTGFIENDAETGTEKATRFEEGMVQALELVLGDEWQGVDNPDGLILTHSVLAVQTDKDFNRPRILRLIPVDVTYVLDAGGNT